MLYSGISRIKGNPAHSHAMCFSISKNHTIKHIIMNTNCDFLGIFMVSQYTIFVYLISVTIFSWAIYTWVNYRISNHKSNRVKRIKELVKDPETVSYMPTDILSDREEKETQKDIVRGVRSRFTIIQRTLFFLILLVWFIALTAPFVGKLPGNILSILIAVLTAVIGIAVKPLVENMISGIVISFSNQLRVGDTLMIDQQYGTVEDISITHTKIKTWDWKRYVIPNSRMLSKEFINLTLNDTLLWAYLEFTVSYDADIERVKEMAIGVASRSEYCTGQEAPQFWIMRMDKEAVTCWVAAWAESPAEAWNLKSDIAINLIKVFRAEGIATHISYVDLTSAHQMRCKR